MISLERYTERREAVATELAWAKEHLSLEEYLDEEFGLLRVKPHITHLKQDLGCYYSYITAATLAPIEYGILDTAISAIYLEGAVKHITGSALDALIVQRFAENMAGVSPCHAADNFSRKRGRIIAKGRLLKVLRKGRLER